MVTHTRTIRLAIASSLLGLTACAPESPGTPGAGPAPAARNVLLLAVDTLRADHLGAYGYARPTSPNLDRLLERSVVFEAAQASSSWTLPSFASLMTGLHASTHGCWRFEHRLDDSFATLAEVLAEQGYATAGVVSHVFLGSEHGLQQGFEDYDEELVLATLRDSHRAISSPAVTDRAIERLERWAAEPQPRPWFLFVHYFDPHKGYREHAEVAERLEGSGPLHRYDQEIAFTDLHVGRLLDRLGALGMERDTVVVFVADHGEEFGDHGGEEHGRTLFREVARVPFALSVPGFAPRRVTEPVATLDMMPTLLELLGLAPALPLDHALAGRSLVPELRGAAPAAGARAGLLLELEPVVAARGAEPAPRLRAWRSAEWKLLVEEGEPGRTRLFDLARDPEERRDVAEEHPDVVARLSQALRSEVEAADALRGRYGEAGALELSDEELQRLRDLGYAGEDER